MLAVSLWGWPSLFGITILWYFTLSLLFLIWNHPTLFYATLSLWLKFILQRAGTQELWIQTRPQGSVHSKSSYNKMCLISLRSYSYHWIMSPLRHVMKCVVLGTSCFLQLIHLSARRQNWFKSQMLQDKNYLNDLCAEGDAEGVSHLLKKGVYQLIKESTESAWHPWWWLQRMATRMWCKFFLVGEHEQMRLIGKAKLPNCNTMCWLILRYVQV